MPRHDDSRTDDSIRGARQRLSERGFDPASLEVAGQAREIAVLNLPDTRGAAAARQIEQIGRMTEELKELGFRYVAIDITDTGVAAEKENQRSHDQEPRQEPKDK